MILNATQIGLGGIQNFPPLYRALESGSAVVIELADGGTLNISLAGGGVRISIPTASCSGSEENLPAVISRPEEIKTIVEVINVCNIILNVNWRVIRPAFAKQP